MSALAPGFSGSIVAIMMGVYHDLLRIISNPLKKLKDNAIFCLPLGIGIVISAIVFVFAFSFLFDAYEKATYLLFVGLIAGNLPVIISETKQHGFRKYNLLCGAVAMIAAFALAMLVLGGGSALSSEGLTYGLPLLALSGLASGGALLIPGMSFSMIMILTGSYGQLIYAAESLMQGNMDYLMPVVAFIICVAGGLLFSSRIIKAVFAKYPSTANTMVLGFITGSLLGMLVQSLRLEDPGFAWWHGAVTLVAGIGLSVLLMILNRRREKSENQRGGADA